MYLVLFARVLKDKTFPFTYQILLGKTVKWHVWMVCLVITVIHNLSMLNAIYLLTTIRSFLALSPNRHHNALGVQYFSHLLNEKMYFHYAHLHHMLKQIKTARRSYHDKFCLVKTEHMHA
eukprot:UN15271